MKDIFYYHKLLKEKKISSKELTLEAINKAKSEKNNSTISLFEDSAMEEATKADALFSKGECLHYLQGIPYSLKDLFITKDKRTTAGSRYLLNYIPPYQGQVAGALAKANGVLISKVGLDEFGMGSSNQNTPFGEVLNPHNGEFSAGGSSGGSAASVVEGSSLFSIGTDTGGSIRLPANFCGLTALKPTYGRVSRFGQISYASSLDQASPIAKTTLDLACIMDAISHYDPRDSSMKNNPNLSCVNELEKTNASYWKNKRVAYDPSFIDSCQVDVKKNLLLAKDRLTKAGATFHEVNLKHLPYSVAVYYLLATSEASANLARYDGIHFGHRSSQENSSDPDSQVKLTLEDTYRQSRSEGLGEEVKKRIMLGTFALSSGYADQFYLKALKVRRLIANDFLETFKKCDVFFSPVCASGAFKRSEITKLSMDPIKVYMNDLYTIPVNLAGLPSIALPFGITENKMPTGFQLVAPSWKDNELLKLGHAWEQIN